MHLVIQGSRTYCSFKPSICRLAPDEILLGLSPSIISRMWFLQVYLSRSFRPQRISTLPPSCNLAFLWRAVGAGRRGEIETPLEDAQSQSFCTFTSAFSMLRQSPEKSQMGLLNHNAT